MSGWRANGRLRERRSSGGPAARGRHGLAPLRPLVCQLRRGAGARAGPQAAGQAPKSSGSRRCSTSCSSIRFSRIVEVLDRSDAGAPRACGPRRCCGSCCRTAPCVRSTTAATPGWCGSTRAGPRRRSGSSSSASSTSSTAPTTCCSWPASSSRFRRLRPLVAIVTSFTIAHSVTLIASAFNFAPTRRGFRRSIETLIAVSIVYMALENTLGLHAEAPLADHVWLRPGARLRLLVRAARDAAVCRRAHAHLAPGVQRRRRDRAAAGDRGARRGDCRSCSSTRSPSGPARSCCRCSWRTPPGTGRSSAEAS